MLINNIDHNSSVNSNGINDRLGIANNCDNVAVDLVLIHCVLVTPYGDIDPGQNCLG